MISRIWLTTSGDGNCPTRVTSVMTLGATQRGMQSHQGSHSDNRLAYSESATNKYYLII